MTIARFVIAAMSDDWPVQIYSSKVVTFIRALRRPLHISFLQDVPAQYHLDFITRVGPV